MIRKALVALAVLVAAGVLAVGPATPASASGCHHNSISASQWGPSFLWTDANGSTWKLWPGPLLFTGGSTSTCSDVNIQNASTTASCGTGANFWYQKYSGGEFGTIQPNPSQILVLYGSSGLTVVKSAVANSSGYRLDVRVPVSCEGSAKPYTPILD
jgi:hypothetical protein